MSPRDRILEAAMTVFQRHGFRRSSIEETAEAAGLTRQALYHHFKSKEALFRAVIERVHDGALADGAAAAAHTEAAGGTLADIIVAQVAARLKAFIASFDGSPHLEELFTEHQLQARDLYRHYATLHDAQVARTIERAMRREKLALASGMTVAKLTRYIGLAINGAKSVHPSMRPAETFLRDAEAMLRTLIAGAVAPTKPAKPSPTARPVRRKAGVR